MAPRLGAAQIRQLGLIQQLQTVAVEVSSLLRGQTVHVLQTQSMRLEELADTEIEDTDGVGQCMNELMLSVLYTELRRDVRQVTDALDRLQYATLSGRRKLSTAQTPTAEHAPASEEEEEEVGTDEMVTADTHRASTAPSVNAGDEEPMPLPLSATSETFRTARGAPMGLVDSGDEGPAQPMAGEQGLEHTTGGDADSLEALERRLREACLEVEEWRRTPCIVEFIATTNGKHAGDADSSSASAAASPRLAAGARLLEEARGRRRALSSGSTASSSSRLLQVEREVEALRPARARDRGPSTAEQGQLHTHASPNNGLSPAGQAQRTHPAMLRLLDASAQEPERAGGHRTIVDDVRIIGWATRGRGLDVHTEFKVVLHRTAGDNVTVLRRYSDFEVLYEVLCDRFPLFAKRIPHLPRKKAFGKFEDKFLKKRESGLQFFLAYVMLHPVIGCSIVIRQWIDGHP
ncbi:hypothetical protein H4R19_001237 [Coemansia spiralis]|nr:hypothetical protein H4R19_001237 [Coemansia spiralis]